MKTKFIRLTKYDGGDEFWCRADSIIRVYGDSRQDLIYTRTDVTFQDGIVITVNEPVDYILGMITNED